MNAPQNYSGKTPRGRAGESFECEGNGVVSEAGQGGALHKKVDMWVGTCFAQQQEQTKSDEDKAK